MDVQQLGMLTFEAAIMAVIILVLFRARTKLGLTPLYIVLGGFQYLEATLTLSVEFAPGVSIRPASTILFTTTLVTVLLIYLKEDALEARKLLYGLVLANVAIAIVSLLFYFQLGLPGTRGGSLTRQDFWEGARIAIVGTTVLFMDVLGIILLYEFVSRFVSSVFLRFYLSLVAIVAFDTALFTLILHWQKAALPNLLLIGFLGKAVASLFYTVVCWTYLRFVEPERLAVGTGDVADVFQALTYRQRYEQVRERMVRDALTGLFNRGYFDETLPRALAHAKRYNEPLSLLMVDTDQFKTINDQFSHMEGDRVLKVIADTLAAISRTADVPCRFGGDEFTILLRADVADAHAFAERFRLGLQERCLNALPPYPWGRVTTTIGIATYPADAEVLTADDLVRVADRRLYEGKKAGRDRVVTLAEREHLIGGLK
jgi:diguanylate cyclase (GGDEF)-like protein